MLSLFCLPLCFEIWAIEVLSFQEVRVLVSSVQECIVHAPEIIFQVGGAICTDGFWNGGMRVGVGGRGMLLI